MKNYVPIATSVAVPLLALGLSGCGSDADTSSATPAAPVTPANVTPGNEEFCEALAKFDNSASGELLDDDDADNAQTQAFTNELKAFNATNAETMPAEIKPAFETLEQDLQSFLAEQSDEGTSALTAVRNAAQMIESLRTISNWTETNCGFEF